MMKKLPIGIEFLKGFKRDNFYYVDKTEFIRDLVQHCINFEGDGDL